MPKATYVAANGTQTTIELKAGESLMTGATRSGVEGISGDCGGVISCATCHVYVDEPYLSRLPAPDGDERTMLDFTAAERLPDSRLCCQLLMSKDLDGIVVRLPDTQY
jgi:2Fe-2S ferredoxin